MSKKRRKSKISKPNPPRSKNNPSGKRKDPDVDRPKYATRAASPRAATTPGGCRSWPAACAGAPGIPEGGKGGRVSAVPVSLAKSEEGPSCRGPVKHFDKHPGGLKRRGLGRPHGKPRRRLRISEIYPAVQHELILWTAGDDAARGTKIVDSSGFSIARYADRYNAKYGKISVKKFAKLHIMQTLRGKTCAATVAPGKANDSPYLRAMIAMMPRGPGYAPADAQYGGM